MGQQRGPAGMHPWISWTMLAAMFVVGVGLRVLIDWANHHGPSGDGWSLQGNGALVFVPLVPLVVIFAEMVALLRRRWLNLPLLPLALVAGMLAGGRLQI